VLRILVIYSNNNNNTGIIISNNKFISVVTVAETRTVLYITKTTLLQQPSVTLLQDFARKKMFININIILVTTHVLHIRSLLLVHLPGPL